VIKKILKIKNFGIFKDFSWSANLDEFKKFNLLYGWNGSGKTTLSKLFTELEKKSDLNLLKNLSNYEFSFTIDNSININEGNYATNSLNVFVFNEIFKEKNIDWDKTIKSILLISNELITEKTDLDKKKGELGNENKQDTVLGKIKKLTSDNDGIQKDIDDFYSKSAKKIKEEFKVIDTSDTYYFNYDKRKFQNFINNNLHEVQNNTPKLDTPTIDKLKESIKPNILNKIELNLKNIEFNWLEKIYQKVLDVLKTSLVVKEVERLKEHPQIGKWVEEGINIHKFYNSSKCEFCNQELPTELLQELERHFSDEFKKLKEKIQTAIIWLPQQKISYEIFENEIELYPEFQDEFKNIKKDVKNSIETINKLFDIWLKSLEQKKDNPFEILRNISAINFEELEKYNILITQLSEILKKHNHKTENFAKESSILKSKLELHYATTFYHEFQLKKKEKTILKNQDDLKALSQTKTDLEKDIKLLEAKLSNEAFGAKEFNEKLHKFLGRDNIMLEFDNINKGYRIIRDGIQANNLSEGEKTAISFVYFITKLKENDNKIADSIIVVDDPISSFDSNNLFSAYSFLKNECENAKQLFVITHNFAYYKLVRDWFLGSRLDNFKRTNVFTIEASIEGLIRSSTLKKAKNSLIKYNSEYHFIFSELFNYKNISLSDTNAYLVGNLSRKLLEAFLSFKYPLKRNDFKQLCDDSIADKLLREKVFRFINKYSHNQTIEFFESSDDTILSESNTIVNDILENIIKITDPKHYEEMEKLCQE